MTAVDVHRECTLELSRSVFITMFLIISLWLTYLPTLTCTIRDLLRELNRKLNKTNLGCQSAYLRF